MIKFLKKKKIPWMTLGNFNFNDSYSTTPGQKKGAMSAQITITCQIFGQKEPWQHNLQLPDKMDIKHVSEREPQFKHLDEVKFTEKKEKQNKMEKFGALQLLLPFVSNSHLWG